MHESAAPPAVPRQQDLTRNMRGYIGGQQQMDIDPAVETPTQDYPPSDPLNDLEQSSPVESRIRQESSDEDDVPLRDRRVRHVQQQDASSMAIQEHRSFQKPAKGSSLSIGKAHKRPGPRPYAAKPIAKNDMKAKMEVIRAIEDNWGKNFIIDYIPKCHRPLQKKKGGKRTSYRQHETDPKKWLPSVLKAVHGISELTNDRAFLKKAMNDIVRHRIKHTGNRKPQLVTTDFDVIEDMITHGWDIETSFSIRYKHLLLAQPKGYLETDEDIDHILACGDDEYHRTSDAELEDEDEEDDDDVDVDGQEDEDSTAFSSPYAVKGAYIHGSPHQPPKMIVPKYSKLSKPIKKEKQEKPTKLAKVPKRPEAAASSPQQAPPPMYGGYGMPGYGPTRFSPFSSSKRSSSYHPDAASARYDASGYSRGPHIKREPGVEDQPIAIEDYDNAPSNYLGQAAREDSQVSDEQMRNEIAEQERHVQMLKARLAKKSRG
ncbi:uncharacterized protein N0V89_008103 [Didymosphaeria variabile]|uniref:Uncharacterized protein n=1 Tax=Didymosphaeria variabile TaxID=1932322 RepID=A0A9W8XGZ0_9PLEO|nr:uncharacterized protein N0V89_008103 [Didymosphaeria variabile]KAJ4349487.1 hypothetical protein N0V89_008103 [Didymosphaeria variabile]